MKNDQRNHLKKWWFCVPIVTALFLTTSCREDYILDEQEPEWLGQSIYDYLKSEGNYKTYVRLIDDLAYTEILSKTGSKTLFVVDDATFDAFFNSPNAWNVSSYDELDDFQKTMILYSQMLNNVFYSHMLGDIPSTDINKNPEDGMCIRRNTAAPSVVVQTPWELLPHNAYWQSFDGRSAWLMTDNTSAPMVNFTEDFRVKNSMTTADIAFLNGVASYEKGDVYINGAKVVESNIKCKNGVVHRLNRLALPLDNMAQTISQHGETSKFSELLDRFSAPYYSESETILQGGDSVFVKKYFAKRGHGTGLSQRYMDYDGNGQLVVYAPADTLVTNLLKYDPGWNTYRASTELMMEEDMGVMFVPSDAALKEYWEGGGGDFLREAFGTWENVPDYVLDDFVNNHMKERFTSDGVPSKFPQVKNDAHIDMGVDTSHVEDVILCNNGVVYVTNRVFPPVSYVAVSAPTLVNENMAVMREAINNYGFTAYLHSMDSYYSFVLPTDEALKNYIDPISVAKGEPERFEFVYDARNKRVVIEVYDAVTGGYKRTETSQAVVQDRLEDLIDYHIIVDDIEDSRNGKVYYRTKGNGTIKVTAEGSGFNLFGGYQLEQDSIIQVKEEQIKDQTKEGNGKTYIVENALMQPSHQSVYNSLLQFAQDESGDFYEFVRLMEVTGVLGLDDTYASFGNTVTTFNTYHYTIYIPDNEAVKRAHDNGLPVYADAVEFADSVEIWVAEGRNTDYINQLLADGTIYLDKKGQFDAEAYKDSVLQIVTDFVNYHIQDNSVYIGGGAVTGNYETASLDPVTNTFYRLNVSADNENMTVTDVMGNVRTVVKEEGKYNMMARDYLFGPKPSKGRLDIEDATLIETSSFAVIHKISDALYFKDFNENK